jgi:hypothetical protein
MLQAMPYTRGTLRGGMQMSGSRTACSVCEQVRANVGWVVWFCHYGG